jgi:two-component system, CitB family, sensor kinase
MQCIVRLNSRNWSLARQLIVLQLCVVVIAVAIEAMVAIYRGPLTAASLEQRQVLGLVTLTEVALLVGISGSLFVAESVRRQTFDMEPAEIARRYQHHDAMLHAVREGLIITDVNGGIVLANDEARRLLGLADGCADAPLRDQVAGAEWAAAEIPVTDQLQYAAGRVLMVSRSRAEVDGKSAGMVTTLRDRTELQEALLELSEARVLANELRKQAHEHANHLQMIVNLIETGKYGEAVGVCTRYADMPQMLSTQVLRQVADPVLAARLQISHGWAERHGVELRLAGTLELTGRDSPGDLADIIGALVDNAIEATSDSGQGSWVQLSLVHGTDACLRITVRDNGPGITADPVEKVFMPGWTTKDSRHGYGLARVRDKVWHMGGTITAHNDGGAVFEVRIPIPREQVGE